MNSFYSTYRHVILSGLTAAARIVAIVGIVAAAIDNPLIGAGIIYVLFFMLIAFRRPDIAIMLVFASAPFQNDLSEGGSVKFSIAEINLLLTFVAFILNRILDRKPIRYGPAFLPVMIYFAVCTIATATSFHDSSAVVAYVQMILYLVVAIVVFSQFLPNQESCQLALKAALVVSVVLAIAQMANPGDYVLGLHKNGIGSSLACGLVIAIDYWFGARDTAAKRRIVFALIVIAAGLICSLSRGAWLGAAAGAGVLAVMRQEYKLFVRGLVIVSIIFLLVWSHLPDQEQSYTVNFDSSRDNISRRLDTISYTQQLFKQSPIIGNGIQLRKEVDATNLFWMTLAESGLLGLVSFVLLNVAFLRMFWQGYKMAPRDSVDASLFAIGSALLVVHFAHAMVDHYWSRGAIMMVWASAGMATGAYLRMTQSKPRSLALRYAFRGGAG